MRSILQGAVVAMGLAITGSALAGEPVNNYQNSVAIRFSVINTGPMMGSIFMFAGNFDPYGTLAADGGFVSISQNMQLYSQVGLTFGGDSFQFQMPDLVGRAMIGDSASNPAGTAVGTATYEVTGAEYPTSLGGGGAPIQNMQPSMSVYAMVSANGVPDTYSSAGGANQPYAGQVIYSAATAYAHERYGDFEWVAANGGETWKSDHPALVDAIGETYGTSSNPDLFVAPDLSDRVAFGDGAGSGIGTQSGSNEMYLQPVHIPSEVVDGAPYSNKQAGLSMRYLICVEGGIPPSPFAGPAPGDLSQGLLGQIILYAGDGPIPEGWMLADGSLLPMAGNELLFSVLGVSYGGNGMTNFAIPDLVNYIPIGSGGDIYSGQTFGTNFTALTPDQIPEPGTGALLGLGLAGLLAARRRRVES